MSKVKIAGQAVVVESALALEDIKKVKKYRPDALTLRGGEGGKEPIFSIGVGGNEIGKYGASFSHETRDDEKKATLTMYLPDNVTGSVEEYVADMIGAGIINLNKLEEQLPAVITEIDAEKAAIMSNISVA